MKLSEQKNTVNTDFFYASEHGIYDVVLPLATKNHGIYSIFWPVPSKNTGIYSMLQEVLFPCQRHKNTVNYSVLGLLLGFVEGAEGGGPEMNSNRLNNQVPGLVSLPFTS